MRYTYGLILVCCYALTLGCTTSVSLLEQVKARGELIIATRNSATAYYEGVDGPAGFEYDLAQQFAHYLGVKLHLIIPNNLDQLWVLVDNRRGGSNRDPTTRKKIYVRAYLPENYALCGVPLWQ